MSGAPRIQLCRLFERTSQRGNRYLTGRLGNAKVIAFEAADLPNDQRYGADLVWNVYLQAPDEERDQAQRQAPVANALRGQRTHDRSRAAARQMQEPPQGWLDDTAAVIADLEGRR
jgi:hypothetical protein